MKSMGLVIVGSAGRMGQALLRMVCETDGVHVSGALEKANSPSLGRDAGEIAGLGNIGITIGDDPQVAFANADGVLDFTTPESSVAFADQAASSGIAHVIGTTGCTDTQDAEIRKSARRTAIVKSGNMSLGVNLLAVLVEQAARALDAADFDIEILEMHHRHKVDAPSGTALLLGEAAARGRKIELSRNSARGRDGITGARTEGAIGFASLRGGSVIGDHSVILSGPGESITLSHRAEDRSLFARGAVFAAKWAGRQKPGFYSMKDVLNL